MLIKEYRIPLPLSVEEYRIAQLYMISKKSREESKGAGSGVEILVNEPYEDGPGGKGQYTHKIYHVGSHLPGWFKGLLPKSALTVEEMAWNAYPYTKTRFTCPFVQRFSLEIETYYCGDAGHQENVFKLSGSELRNRVVDVIDVVRDQLHGADYVREEDPRVYVSQKTGRGPVDENWIEEYWNECKGKEMPLPNGKAIMSAYKLCKVEFHYWGMQSKIEKFIHDIALRKTMLRAHRQAWAWQDEWFGLTMEDIREIEKATQEALKKKMALDHNEDDDDEDDEESHARRSSTSSSMGGTEQDNTSFVYHGPSSSNISRTTSSSSANANNSERSNIADNAINNSIEAKTQSSENPGRGTSTPTTPVAPIQTSLGAKIKFSVSDMSDMDNTSQGDRTPVPVQKYSSPSPRHKSSLSSSSGHGGGSHIPRKSSRSDARNKDGASHRQKNSLSSPGANSNKSLELLAASWRMEGLMRKDSDSGSEEEFFDCLDGDDSVCLTKWSSLDLLPQDSETPSRSTSVERYNKRDDSVFSQTHLHRATSATTDLERKRRALTTRGSIEVSLPGSPTVMGHGSSNNSHNGSSSSCRTTVLCLVIHAGSALDATMDLPTKKSDVTTFRGAFESVIRQHYPSMLGHVAIKLVPCPSVCTDALGILSSLSPFSFSVFGLGGDSSPKSLSNESVPIGAIPLLASSQQEYWDAVGKAVGAANQVYQEFLKSEAGTGFSGHVAFIGDSIGSILAYDALTKHSNSAQCTNNEDENIPPSPAHGVDLDHLHAVPNVPADRRRSSSSTSDSGNAKLDFEVNDLFMFGSPLGIVLAHRKMQSDDKNMQLPRPCQQVYSLFHPTDPLATRLEPLISARFAAVPPVNVSRYAKYPLGDGQPYHLLECIQCNAQLVSESGVPVLGASLGGSGRRLSEASIQSGMSGLSDVLPLQAINILTQKWWGNKRIDYALYCPEALANFPTNSLPHLFHASYWESTDAIAFILRQIGFQDSHTTSGQDDSEIRLFSPNQPREKWIKKRTSVKLKNVAANHRANDVIVKEGSPQILKARFLYGPLDMVTLTGEKVDIYIMKDPPVGEWSQIASEITDKNGRIGYLVPPDKSLGYGIYPVKMVVRGDHTCVDFYLAVVPPNTECVVFSIDGSFTASMSVTGRDPRVRAGAVDITRHWQELGYLIIYVTGRPDMQQHKVVSWLAQHNFPHGLVSFADGLSTDFLGHKTEYLKSLVQEHRLVIHAAYGSSKDISVYTSVGVSPDKIFIIGKASKKQHSLATVLSEGYSTHLNALMVHGGSRPAHGNARMVIPRGYFGLPGQPMSMRRRRSAKRTTSFPVSVMTQGGESSLMTSTHQSGSRGLSPRGQPKSTLPNK